MKKTIRICDICKKTETSKGLRVKHHKDLSIDICDECRKLVPEGMPQYVQFVYKHTCGIDITLEKAKDMLKMND